MKSSFSCLPSFLEACVPVPAKGETAVLLCNKTLSTLTRFTIATVYSSLDKQSPLSMGYLVIGVSLMGTNLLLYSWLRSRFFNVTSLNRIVLNPLCTRKSSHDCYYLSLLNLHIYINIYIFMCARSVLSNSVTPWIVACKAPLSMEFSRQEYWSGFPFPSAMYIYILYM